MVGLNVCVRLVRLLLSSPGGLESHEERAFSPHRGAASDLLSLAVKGSRQSPVWGVPLRKASRWFVKQLQKSTIVLENLSSGYICILFNNHGSRTVGLNSLVRACAQ